MTKPIENKIKEPNDGSIFTITGSIFTLETIPEEIIDEDESDDESVLQGDLLMGDLLIFGFPPSPTESSPIDYSPPMLSPIDSVPQSPAETVDSCLFVRRERVFITETPSNPEERIVAGFGGPYTYARFGDDADDVDEIWWDDEAIERYIDIVGITICSEKFRIQCEWKRLMDSVGVSYEHQPPIPRWFIASCFRAYGPELDFDHDLYRDDEFVHDRLTNDDECTDDLADIDYELGFDVVLDVK